jgi:hypothetical protein
VGSCVLLGSNKGKGEVFLTSWAAMILKKDSTGVSELAMTSIFLRYKPLATVGALNEKFMINPPSIY